MAAVVAERDQLQHDNQALTERLNALEHQLAWFKRQLFGQTSERRPVDPPPEQLNLGEIAGATGDKPSPTRTIPAPTRRATARPAPEADESTPFFDDGVPVETIHVPAPEADATAEIVSEKISYRLAQRPASYVVLKYVRPVIKQPDDKQLLSAPAPDGVLGTSRADVSFIAGLIIDKLAYHLPLYRQHQRLAAAGIEISRPWLTQLFHQAAGLLEPIHEAQLDSIRASRVIAIDETPIKAGRKGKGKLKTGYFWPVYGEADEIGFVYHPSRGQQHVIDTLGRSPPADRVLISDGYSAYARYAEATGLTHAQCWSHTRRKFIQAETAEPDAVAQALDWFGRLYAVEVEIRAAGLTGTAKKRDRLDHAQPIVAAFFAWVDEQLADQGLLPSNPLTTALGYARDRRLGLEIYLTDPEVPIDTNHLERALRAIPMGRKAWLFCWSEVGAKDVGILQSLITTCRLHGINVYDYLVDVLQRIDRHPASDVAALTPRLWQQQFADQPLRSDLHRTSD